MEGIEEPDDGASIKGENEMNENSKRKLEEAGLDNEGDSNQKSARFSESDGEDASSKDGKTEDDENGEEEEEVNKELLDAEQKLKEMDEISFKSVSKGHEGTEGTEPSDTKKRKVTNLRKNIKDVLDETQLDASTLAAQKEEMERLARVQEQQRVLREAQRQTAMGKLSKTEEKVLQFLQGHANLGKSSQSSSTTAPTTDEIPKTSATDLTPSVTIRPVIPNDDKNAALSGVVPPVIKKDVVTISSDEEDCIVLSDDDEIEDDEDPNNCGLHTNDTYNVPDAQGRVLVNDGHAPDEPDIFLAPQLGKIVKPHQIGGIRFLYDNIIEATSRYDTSTGFGCILAHSMGLGKTLQVVSFCDIFLRHTSSKTVLIIMPINTLQNWLHEFNMWLPETVSDDQKGQIRPREFKVFILNDNHKTLASRSDVVFQWAREGGVLMIGYEMYRLLSMKKMSKTKRKVPVAQLMTPQQNEEQKTMFDSIHEALVCPGPDLVICDEGHRIKNSHASISVALKQIKSKRRIVLTGYPLQNNLMEYWCMVDFVRPNYLGTKTEFSNMFERPIQNGQCIDSTPQDCKLMRYRAHVLHSLLLGFVQRRSHRVLQSTLPLKQEFVLMVRMTPFQRKLYDTFMTEVVRTKNVPNPLKAFAVCCKIWNHPDVLYNFLKKREADIDLELDDVLETASSTSSATQSSGGGGKKRGRKAAAATKDLPKEKSPEVLKPVALQASTTSTIAPNNVPPAYSHPPASYSPYSSTSTGSASSSSYHSTPNSYHNNLNYYNNTQTTGNNGNYYPNYNQNYWPGYYGHGQEQYNHQYYGQGAYQSQGWFDQKNETAPPFQNWNAADQQGQGIAPVKTEIKEEKINCVAKEEEKPKTLDTVISTDNKLAEEIKEEVEGAKIKDDSIPYDWAVELLKGYTPDLLSNSPKMEVLFCLLEETILLGDRMLLFSQSLLTLNVIEKFLQKSKIPNSDVTWMKNVSYFRLDGSTVAQEREKLINEFNANKNVHLFLVSTRAGSLGINLVGANRVVVFDTSWNPCHDTQAVCRVYRYGQQKPCFVYRIVMDACLEKKIYDRQINKQGMSDRVVDECNPDAYLSMKEITNLCYDDEEITEVEDFVQFKEEYKDSVIHTLLEKHSYKLTKKPFQHESLFVDRKEKKLSSAEKRLAQRGYEMEKQASSKPAYTYTSMGTQYRAYRTPDGQLIHKAVQSLGRGRPPLQDKDRLVSRNMPRPTTWIPADVWIKQGMEAREMTLPLDVVIPTSSQTKENIILKAGQRVMVLKSSKGIYMQLESGKIISIRSTAKSSQGTTPGLPDAGQASSAGSGVEQALQNIENANKPTTKVDSDDDECVMTSITYPTTHKASPQSFNLPSTSATNTTIPQQSQQQQVSVPNVHQEREKPFFKPNLVQRKPRVSPETFGSQSHATTTTNGGSGNSYNYNQHFTNYDSPHNQVTGNNTTFSHANAQHFSNYDHSKPVAPPVASHNFKPTDPNICPIPYPGPASSYNNSNRFPPLLDQQQQQHGTFSYGALPYAGPANQMHSRPAANGGSFNNAPTNPRTGGTNPQSSWPTNWQNETQR